MRIFDKKKKKVQTVIAKENPYKDFIELREKARKKEIALKEQATLDFQKYLESEYKGTDLSGLMPWCLFCDKKDEHHKCTCSPEDREANALCVKPYHVMKEKIGE